MNNDPFTHHVEINTTNNHLEKSGDLENELRTLMRRSPEFILGLTKGYTSTPPRGVQYGICFCFESAIPTEPLKQILKQSEWLNDLNKRYAEHNVQGEVYVWHNKN